MEQVPILPQFLQLYRCVPRPFHCVLRVLDTTSSPVRALPPVKCSGVPDLLEGACPLGNVVHLVSLWPQLCAGLQETRDCGLPIFSRCVGESDVLLLLSTSQGGFVGYLS